MRQLLVIPVLVVLLLATLSPVAAQTQSNTIVDIAVADGRFTTLVQALQQAGLVETLQGDGPFTVFAPTNDAFAKLPSETLESLLQDKEALTNVLTYHVVPGDVMAATVVQQSSLTTVQGEEVPVRVEGDTVTVGGAEVVITDIEASNGVIHVIDTVLLPPSTTSAAPATLPTTGGDSNPSLIPLLLVAAGILLLGGRYALARVATR